VRVARAHDDDRHILVDEGDRPVLHLPGRVALGMDVRDLLQLERALERDREVRPAAEEQHVARAKVLLRDQLQLVATGQHLAHLRRHVPKRIEHGVRPLHR